MLKAKTNQINSGILASSIYEPSQEIVFKNKPKRKCYSTGLNWCMVAVLFGMACLCVSCGKQGLSNTEKFEGSDPLSFPSIQIFTDNLEVVESKDFYVNGRIEVVGDNADENILAEIKIRSRGNSTLEFPKKPYQINFTQKEKVLGMPQDKKWILLANYADKSMLRNELGFDLGRMSNLDWTPESRFVNLFMNEEFVGTYQVTQKVEESSNRVALSDEGFLLEVDQLSRLNDDDTYFVGQHYLFNVKEPKLTEGDEAYTYIADFVRQTEEAIFGENFQDPITGYRKFIDEDALIDWYLINEISRNTDADFFLSVYMHLEPGGKLKMGPLWDFDLGFGNVNYNENHKPDGFYIKNGIWMARFFEDALFVDKVKQRFDYFYNNKELLFENIRSNSDYINDSQVLNYERWETLGRDIWPSYVFFDTYEEEVDYLVNWLDDRLEWMNISISEL